MNAAKKAAASIILVLFILVFLLAMQPQVPWELSVAFGLGGLVGFLITAMVVDKYWKLP